MAPTGPLATPGPNPDASPSPGTLGFSQLLDTALRERGQVTSDPQWGLNSGELQPQALCRYAAGAVTDVERRDLEGYLARAPWAIERVTALVRGARADQRSPLASRILDSARKGEVDPYKTAALAYLQSVDHTEGLALVERQDEGALAGLEGDGVVKAICFLGLRQLEQARRAFESLEPEGALARAAKRLAGLDEDPDAALAELLSAL